MVLKRIFKSKEQRKKDKLKTDLKKKISNVGGGRSNQGTAKRLQRKLKNVDAPKKEVKKTATRKKGMSNIPVGEGTVNNPNFGKKGDLSMFKTKKKVVKTETPKKKVVKTETPKKVTPKYKQVTQKELDAKIKERSKPKTKPDPLKDYRRGEGTKLGKDTRITKKLKKSGFTEDRLARLRKQHAEFKARRKKK